VSWTTLFPVRGSARCLEASASDVSGVPRACPEGLALKMRKSLSADVVDWSSRRDAQPFMLGAVVAAIYDVEARQVEVEDAVAARVLRPAKPGLRCIPASGHMSAML